MPGQGTEGAETKRREPPTMAPRVPRVHLPYLLVLGLSLGLGGAVLPWIDLASPLAQGLTLFNLVLLGLHLVWIFRIYRDAEAVLQGTLEFGAIAVLLVSLLAFVLVPLWAAIFFWAVLRTEERAARQVDRVGSSELGRCAAEARGLILAGLAYLLVLMATSSQYFDHVEVYSHGQVEEMPTLPFAEALGATGAVLVSSFNLLFVAYYLKVVGRAVPALYRGHQLLVSRRWRPRPDGGAS